MAMYNDFRIVDDNGVIPAITVQKTLDEDKNKIIRLSLDDCDVDMTPAMATDLLAALGALLHTP